MTPNENRFLCPHCRQKLSCEAGYGGWRIQCPACQGAVIVPLALPPPMPAVRPPAQPIAMSPAQTWRRHGILAGCGLGLGLLSAPLIRPYMGLFFGTTNDVASWFSLAFAILVGVSFWAGALLCSQPTDSLSKSLLVGCLLVLLPFLLAGFVWVIVGLLGAGCTLMLGQGDQSLKLFKDAFVLFLVLAFVLSLVAGMLNALRHR